MRQTAASCLAVSLALTVVACQYVGAEPPTGGNTPSATATPIPSVASSPATPTSPPTPSAAPSPTASLSPMEAIDTLLHEQARNYLARWADLVGDAPANAVVLVGELTRGGGWHGPNADNAKSAFVAGAIEANVDLPTEPPPPAEVVFPDGTKQTVALFSAAEALADVISQKGPGDCGGCRPVKVTGAKLVLGEADTSRGRATMPLWQFEFAPEDAPRTPITHPAIRDRVIVPPEPPWNPYGGNPVGDRIWEAYGAAQSSDLTVVFVGAALHGDQWCGADYTAEAVESELAVVVIIHAHSHPPTGSKPQGCWALGAERTAVAHLAAPLGNRTILEVQFGTPVVLLSGEPPEDLPSL